MPIPIITDEQIATLAPHCFMSLETNSNADQDVRDRFLKIYKPLRAEGMDDYNLSRVATALFYYRPLLSALLQPTQSKNVVEIGCGSGSKALAWADLFASYVGIDLIPHRAEQAEAAFKTFGVANARVITGNAEEILREPGRHGIPEIDLLVLYAVLEHLTIPERRSILRLAQDVYRRGGHVLIAESPNRLSPFDAHSFQLPFIEWLPTELQVEYAAWSERKDLTSQLDAAPPDWKADRLYRIGRGLSFHEFACFWDKDTYEGMSALQDGFSASMLNMEPFRREESDLMNLCRDHNINMHRMFKRYWINALLSRRSGRKASPGVRYLPPSRVAPGLAVEEGRGFWDLDRVTIRPDGRDVITIVDKEGIADEAVLLINLARSPGTLTIEQGRAGLLSSRQEATRSISLRTLALGRLPTWHAQLALPLGPVKGKTFRIKIEADSLWRRPRLTCEGALLV
jgi:ubiquinone/menaquinone biosynthesis C-methylase UbiE